MPDLDGQEHRALAKGCREWEDRYTEAIPATREFAVFLGEWMWRAALAARKEPPCPTCGGVLEDGEGSRCSRSGCPTNLMTVAREDTERPDGPTQQLAEFHAALSDKPGRGNAVLRLTLHEEEHEELLDELGPKRLGIDVREPKADEDVDRAKLARELADVVYVSFGTAHAFDIDLDAALAEIHRAAMSKLDPETMVVRKDGKIMKPPGFIPPDMSAAVRDTEQEHKR